MKGCPYCDDLKNKLEEKDIKYVEKDVDENELLYESFSQKVDSEFLPAIMIGKKAFIPEKSFKTIDQAATVIQNYLLELSDHDPHVG
jgi:glutaredoxin